MYFLLYNICFTLKPMDLRILDLKFLFFPKVNINLGLERVWLNDKGGIFNHYAS